MSKRLTPEQQEHKKLLRQIRNCKPYKRWRRKILHRDGWTEKDKGIQCHHLTDISKLIEQYGIRTVKQAIRCTGLWEAKGLTLTRGEHFIMTKLRRFKYLTPGFIALLEGWLQECKTRPRKASKYI